MVMLEHAIDTTGDDSAAAAADPFVQLALVDGLIDDLAAADMSGLDDAWCARYARSVDEVLARVDALAVGVAAEARRRGHDRSSGFFSTKSWVKHHAQVSGPEAHGRSQVMRLFDLAPTWAKAAKSGEVGVGQTRLMARVAANPRVHVALVEYVEVLLADAIVLSYDEFERRLRDFARCADQSGATTQAKQNHEGRDAGMRQRRDGSWFLWATFGSLQGAQINETLAHFIQAEWEADWAEARGRCGGGASMSDLVRTESQRRADAIGAMAGAAAVAPGDGRAALPTLNIVVDEATAEAIVTGGRLDAGRYAEMICRTENGDVIDCSEAAALGLWGQIRRVVRDSAGVVIELGRRSRLFTGGARDAVMLLSDRCLWPGCDRPVRSCQADHSLEWAAHGATVPRNGGVMCRAHNLFKERHGFTARRQEDGGWVVRNGDGDPIG